MKRERCEGFWIADTANDREIVECIYKRDHYRLRRWAAIHSLLPDARNGLVIDVGAHVGTFSRLWHELNPEAKIVAVEMTEDSVELLRENVGSFATVLHATCTYLPWDAPAGRRKITLEEIVELAGEHYIKCLKLDCEGYEFDILENAQLDTLRRCKVILGEYHGWERGREKLLRLVGERIPEFIWEQDTEQSHFWLYNPYYLWRRDCGA